MIWRATITLCLVATLSASVVQADEGVLPLGDDGKPLNLDFEKGTLEDWTATGNAFVGQPIRGDSVAARRSDMRSRHAGHYWIGTYEIDGDGPRGILTSKPFKVTHPFASFLIGGGADDCRVEIVTEDDNKVFFHASGHNREDMRRVAVDLRPIAGRRIFIRVVDDHSFSWGHVNFDDFKFHTEPPKLEQPAGPPPPDVVKHSGLSPDQAARAIILPEGFRATLFAGEPDIHQPVGFAIDHRGRLWVAEAHNYPLRAPEGQGKDRILIFEDTDNDGRFDKRTVFIENLNLVSGIEVGFGGVWVGAAPYFMFIPDRDGDDKPDGPPEILLDGWGYHDTHETLNAFIWGPDGWLYGCHGVFTHSRVGKPGTPNEDRIPLNAAIWRYHPTKHIFEIFAEGTSNPWGVDFNDHGQAFATACVIPHLFHIIQGARYHRQAGSHFNPYIYADIKTIADHVHWAGDQGPHAGNNRSSEAGGGHAHCGAMVYLGDSFPDRYRNTIFMGNIHGNRANNDILEARGSGYVGRHAPDFLLMDDKWSRLINLKYGPDGSVFVIDWYDKQACHNTTDEIWDRSNGRIYKIVYERAARERAASVSERNPDLAKLSDAELVELQLHRNDYFVRHARRILQERRSDVRAPLEKILRDNPDPTRKLRALWSLHASGNLSRQTLAEQLSADDPYLRAWAIQLAAEEGDVSDLLSQLASMARSDPSPVVRLYLASSLQRIAPAQRWEVLEGLSAHSEDADDHNLPLMIWYAAEPAVASDIARAIELARQSQIPLLRQFIARRLTQLGAHENNSAPLSALAQLLLDTPQAPAQRSILTGMSQGLHGIRRLPMPPGWEQVHDRLGASRSDAVRLLVQSLSTTFGDERALSALRAIVQDRSAPAGDRIKSIDALAGAQDIKLPAVLIAQLDDPAVRASAIKALGAYEDESIPDAILAAYPALDSSTRNDALSTLASRISYARALRAAIDSEIIPRSDVSQIILRQLHDLDDADLRGWVGEVFGQIRSTPQEKLAEIERLKRSLSPRVMASADLSHGRALFVKNCIQCHTLFDAGGTVGPDITGSNRADLDYILSNLVDPNAVIGRDYQLTLVRTRDGRIVSGIVKADDGRTLTLMTENETLVIPHDEITARKTSEISMMPEGLLAALNPADLRDLIAYLASPSQVPIKATADNVASFFNGKDLTGWSGNSELWSVENGEIVGRSPGLSRNEFLFSDYTAGDFRLTLQVRLVKNTGNSGIQFRSAALPDRDIKGYQADIGPGWWGKLYDEHGRGTLAEPAEVPLDPDGWNTYEIVAVGDRIMTALNGKKMIDLTDPPGAKQGIFALQLHSGPAMEIRFKDLKLELNPRPELVTVERE